MTKYTGQNGLMEVGSGQAVGQVQNFSLEITADTTDSTTQLESWKDNEPLQKSWSGSATALWDPADLGQDDLIEGAIIDVTLKPAGAVQANEFSGTAIITSRSIPSPMDGMVTNDIAFIGKGALTEQTAT